MKQQNKKVSKDFSSVEVGVLLESMNDNIKLVVEQHGGIVDRLDKIDKTLEDHTEMIAGVATDIAVLKEDSTIMKEDITVLKDDVGIIKEDIDGIKHDLKRKADIAV